MTLWQIVFRSLRQHALSTMVTGGSIALATALLLSVWAVRDQSREVFTRADGGFDAVLGPRASELQLVLNGVFHLEHSPGNIGMADWVAIRDDPSVALAVPIGVGDSHRGYRVVGTVPEYFTRHELAPGKKFALEPGGAWFDPGRAEAVVGSHVARKLGLRRGSRFHPQHGVGASEREEHEESYVVTGVLKPSNTPADRVIWIPLEGIQQMSGHATEAAGQVSAVLLKFRSPMAGKILQVRYNREGSRLTLAWPIATIIAQLFDKIGWMSRLLEAIALMVVLVAAASILASIYNSMSERRRDLAILRALGARRTTVFSAVILEATAIATLGVAAAFLLYLLILTGAGHWLRQQTGVTLDPFAFHPVLLAGPAGVIGLSALAGIIPALKAYRTDVASTLAPGS